MAQSGGVFFQDGTPTGKVKLADCLMYTVRHPDPKRLRHETQKKNIRKAQKEAREYIQNVRNKFKFEQTVPSDADADFQQFCNFSAEFYQQLYKEMPKDFAEALVEPKTPFKFK